MPESEALKCARSPNSKHLVWLWHPSSRRKVPESEALKCDRSPNSKHWFNYDILLPGGRCRKAKLEVWPNSKLRALVYDIHCQKAKLWVCPKSKPRALVYDMPESEAYSVPQVQTPSTGLNTTSFIREEGAGKRSFKVCPKSKLRWALVYDILCRKAKLWVCPKSKLKKTGLITSFLQEEGAGKRSFAGVCPKSRLQALV